MNDATPATPSLSSGFRVLLVALLMVGVVSRVTPFLDQDGRLLQQFPTEDGYLMLTIARNLAIGNGFSVSDGEIATNGTQPLTTLIWTAGFLLVGGDRTGGVAIALILQLLAGFAIVWALYRLGQRLFRDREHPREKAALGACAWYASSVALPHTMNCLETGFYALVVVLVAHVFMEIEDKPRAAFGLRRSLALGSLLGVAFWIRNDAAFLILAACVTYTWFGWRAREALAKKRIASALVFGATSVLVASPWLAFNFVNFGHIMPVSGRAESLTGSFGSNLSGVPIVLAEYAMTVVPIPHALKDQPLVLAAATGIVLATAGLAVHLYRVGNLRERSLIALGGLYVLGLSIFYGLFFGAPWFLSRYFLPASPFFALLWSGVAVTLFVRYLPRTRALLIAPALLVLLVAGLNVRIYRGGADHMHFQVVEWIDANLSEETWVGAIQTGTIGYFHDRTINLDGKVNPHAYHAHVEGRIGRYVAESKIEYLADWVGMNDWRTKPEIDEAFELLLLDRERNLAVLKRKPSPEPPRVH